MRGEATAGALLGSALRLPPPPPAGLLPVTCNLKAQLGPCPSSEKMQPDPRSPPRCGVPRARPRRLDLPLGRSRAVRAADFPVACPPAH